jgi:hypothetical protein
VPFPNVAVSDTVDIINDGSNIEKRSGSDLFIRMTREANLGRSEQR